MQYFARVVNGVVVEIVTIPDGASINDFFHASLVPQFVACPSTTAVNYVYANGTFSPPPVVAPTTTQLAGWATALQQAISAGGISVNIGTSAAPQEIKASTDATSLVLLQGAYTIAAANAAATFQWVSGVTSVTLTAAQMVTIFNAVTAFLQASFTTLSQVLYAINAGTITTMAQIDTPPSPIPAWPVNS